MSSRKNSKLPKHLLTNVQLRCRLANGSWRSSRPRWRRISRSTLIWTLSWLMCRKKNNRKLYWDKKLRAKWCSLNRRLIRWKHIWNRIQTYLTCSEKTSIKRDWSVQTSIWGSKSSKTRSSTNKRRLRRQSRSSLNWKAKWKVSSRRAQRRVRNSKTPTKRWTNCSSIRASLHRKTRTSNTI